MHLSGLGDYQISEIEILQDDLHASTSQQSRRAVGKKEQGVPEQAGMEVEGGGGGGGGGEGEGDAGGMAVQQVVRCSEGQQEPLIVLNTPDPLAGEQVGRRGARGDTTNLASLCLCSLPLCVWKLKAAPRRRSLWRVVHTVY